MKKLVLLLTTVVFVGSILLSCGGGSDKDKEMFAQWFKIDGPEQWGLRIVSSKHDFVKATANPQFPNSISNRESDYVGLIGESA
jgi:hypothetical protein